MKDAEIIHRDALVKMLDGTEDDKEKTIGHLRWSILSDLNHLGGTDGAEKTCLWLLKETYALLVSKVGRPQAKRLVGEMMTEEEWS